MQCNYRSVVRRCCGQRPQMCPTVRPRRHTRQRAASMSSRCAICCTRATQTTANSWRSTPPHYARASNRFVPVILPSNRLCGSSTIDKIKFDSDGKCLSHLFQQQPELQLGRYKPTTMTRITCISLPPSQPHSVVSAFGKFLNMIKIMNEPCSIFILRNLTG